MRSVDVTAVVTFHREGLIAHRSLTSILRSCKHAETQGITTRIVATLDNADSETRRVVTQHPGLRSDDVVADLSFSDVAASRNYAIQIGESRYISIFDGDDQVSANWLEAALHRLDEMVEPSIIHPQMVITFDVATQFREQPDQSIVEFDRKNLLVTNFWNVCSFASKDVFLSHPYESAVQAGFGFEDWHWNCETVAAGYKHLTAPRTVYFERRKQYGSLNNAHQLAGAVILPSRLFGRLE